MKEKARRSYECHSCGCGSSPDIANSKVSPKVVSTKSVQQSESFSDWLIAGGLDPKDVVSKSRLRRLHKRYEAGRPINFRPLAHGEVKRIANEIGTTVETVSRWLHGQITPSKISREALKRVRPNLTLPTDF